MIYEQGINEFRAQQRQEAIERHKRTLQQDKEQQERIAAEKEAKKLPFHEEMKQLAERDRKEISRLQPGDIHATEKLRQSLRDAFSILQYLLAALDKQEGPQGSAGEPERGPKAAER